MDTAAMRERAGVFWDQQAPGWLRQADRNDACGRPFGAVALERLAPRAGERILDIGCGPGGTTAELAVAVGPAGRVVGLDLSPAMVAGAQRRFPDLTFVAADIETADTVAGAPFDAAYSRLALMLLADPVAGLANIRRALRPGGRLAATVFRSGAGTPWLASAMLGAAPYLGPMPPLPIGDEPGPFAFADSDRIHTVLDAAGWRDIATEPHDIVLLAGDEPDAVAEWLIELGPASAPYRGVPADAQERARAGTVSLLERFRTPGTGYRLPSTLWLVTAKVPS